MKKTLPRNILLTTCRLVLSVAFIFAGFTKLIDPMGTVYKITEYILAFDLAEYLPPEILIKAMAVTLATLEFTIGIFILFAINRRFTTYIALIFMLVMTPLTLYLAIANPISDCGCFGDVIKLSNWQTLGKNIILLCCAAITRYWDTEMTRIISIRGQWMIRLYCVSYSIVVGCYSILMLPPLDLSPYRIGTDIATSDETINFLAIDIDTGDDHTPEILSSGYSLLLISDNLAVANDGEMVLINMLATYANRHDMRFAMLTASEQPDVIERWRDLTGAEYPIFWADETELRSIVRSNPGLVLIKDGIVYNKWSHFNIPKLSINDLSKPLEQQEWIKSNQTSKRDDILVLLAWFVLPLLLWTILDKRFNVLHNRKKHNTLIP